MTHCHVNHHITGHLVFLFVSVERSMKCSAIDMSSRTNCELKTQVLQKSIMNYAYTVYGQGTVGQWCRMPLDGRAKKCSRWRGKCSSICSVMILFKVVMRKCVKEGVSQFQEFRVNFYTFHTPCSMYGIITVRLGCQVLCEIGSGHAYSCTKCREWFSLCCLLP
jgi:hypothetical protein